MSISDYTEIYRYLDKRESKNENTWLLTAIQRISDQ
ncbi:hypothetical protein NIES3275_54570 [Microchaete diplosiphon NIES-3275]|nr:hypothetical protein NIES3275_54570 [Microchaete diplosiphon NIES-3275]